MNDDPTDAQTKNPDDVLTTAQVMAEYGISRTGLWRLKDAKLLAPIPPGGLLVHAHENTYRRGDIERAVTANKERRTNRRKRTTRQS